MPRTVFVIFFFGLILHAEPLFAGAWVQEEGKQLHITTYSFYTTERSFGSHGDLDRIPNNGRFTKHELNHYAEFGLTKRFTAIGNFFFDFLEFKDDGSRDRNQGFSDQELGGRLNLTTDPLIFSLQGLVIFPTYSLKTTPLLGNKDTGVEGRLLFAKEFSFFRVPSYVNTEVGVRFREGEPSDQLRYQLGWGLKPAEGWELILALDGIEGLRNEKPLIVSNNVVINPDFSFLKLTGSLVIPIVPNRVSFEIGGFRHLSGRDTGEGWGVKSAVWLRF